jgi:hypothetical protein
MSQAHEPPEPPQLYAVPPPDDDFDTRTPPHDEAAERAVLGAMMTSPQAITDVLPILTPTDFHRPAHELIYTAIADLRAAGNPADAVTVCAHLIDRKELPRVGGAPYLHDLISAVVSPESAPYSAAIVADRAGRRAIATAGTRIAELGYTTGGDLDTITAAATEALSQATEGHTTAPARHAPDIEEFLAQADDDDYDWVIPNTLERGDRLILTAPEGAGKSTLLRQVAVQAASGVHPFTGHPMPPARVLLVDLENSERQTRRKLRPLHAAAGAHLDDPDRLHIEVKLDGLDLTQPCDERWLSDLVAAHRPDVLVTGPIYKLAAGNPNDEKDAKPAAFALDRIRATHGCAIVLEAHTRKAEGGDPKKRPKEPYGWSGWMRWPEFGIHLDVDGTLTHWRGMRDERTFPGALNRGGRWPWTPALHGAAHDDEARWVALSRAITHAGRDLSVRELEDATGIPKSTVARVLGAYSMQRAGLLGRLRREAEEGCEP